MAVNDVIEITDCQLLHGVEVSNVWHFRVDADASSGALDNPEDCAKAFDNNLVTHLTSWQSDEVEHTCIKAQKVHPTVGPAYEHDISEDGVVASVSLPANNAAICGLESSTVTKKGRGRKYLVGVPTAMVQDGDIMQSTWSAIRIAFLNFKTPVTGPDSGQFQAIVWSRDFPLIKVINRISLRSRIKGLRPRTAVT